jgi:hypothetical protein
MAQVRDGRWSLQGKTALITGGTKGIGFVSLSLAFIFSFTKGNLLYVFIAFPRYLKA